MPRVKSVLVEQNVKMLLEKYYSTFNSLLKFLQIVYFMITKLNLTSILFIAYITLLKLKL